jgi:uncharacterized membrane protein HdeD (DUF308 family)
MDISKKNTRFIINGIISVIIGLVFMINSGEAIESVLSVLGLLMSVMGVIMLIKYYIDGKKYNVNNPLLLIEGVFNFAIGLVIFIKPDLMLHFVLFIIGLWALFSGIIEIFYIFKMKDYMPVNYFMLSGGIISIIIGILFVFYPELIVSTFAFIVGIILFTTGLFLLYFAYKLHKTSANITDAEIIEQ